MQTKIHILVLTLLITCNYVVYRSYELNRHGLSESQNNETMLNKKALELKIRLEATEKQISEATSEPSTTIVKQDESRIVVDGTTQSNSKIEDSEKTIKERLNELLKQGPRTLMAEIVAETIVNKASGEAKDVIKSFSLEEDTEIELSKIVSEMGEEIKELLLQASDLDEKNINALQEQIHTIGQSYEDRAIGIIGADKYNAKSEEHRREMIERHAESFEESADDVAILSHRLDLTKDTELLLEKVFKGVDDDLSNQHGNNKYHALICVECLAKQMKLLNYYKSSEQGAAEFDFDQLQKKGPIYDYSYAKNRLRSQKLVEQLGGVLSPEQLLELQKYLITD